MRSLFKQNVPEAGISPSKDHNRAHRIVNCCASIISLGHLQIHKNLPEVQGSLYSEASSTRSSSISLIPTSNPERQITSPTLSKTLNRSVQVNTNSTSLRHGENVQKSSTKGLHWIQGHPLTSSSVQTKCKTPEQTVREPRSTSEADNTNPVYPQFPLNVKEAEKRRRKETYFIRRKEVFEVMLMLVNVEDDLSCLRCALEKILLGLNEIKEMEVSDQKRKALASIISHHSYLKLFLPPDNCSKCPSTRDGNVGYDEDLDVSDISRSEDPLSSYNYQFLGGGKISTNLGDALYYSRWIDRFHQYLEDAVEEPKLDVLIDDKCFEQTVNLRKKGKIDDKEWVTVVLRRKKARRIGRILRLATRVEAELEAIKADDKFHGVQTLQFHESQGLKNATDLIKTSLLGEECKYCALAVLNPCGVVLAYLKGHFSIVEEFYKVLPSRKCNKNSHEDYFVPSSTSVQGILKYLIHDVSQWMSFVTKDKFMDRLFESIRQNKEDSFQNTLMSIIEKNEKPSSEFRRALAITLFHPSCFLSDSLKACITSKLGFDPNHKELWENMENLNTKNLLRALEINKEFQENLKANQSCESDPVKRSEENKKKIYSLLLKKYEDCKLTSIMISIFLPKLIV